MKVSNGLGITLICLALGAFATAGCGDSDGDGNGGPGSGSSLSRAGQAACDKIIECTPEDSGIDRDSLCLGFDGFETAARFLGGKCAKATEDFLNCFANTPCDDDTDRCESKSDAIDAACDTGDN